MKEFTRGEWKVTFPYIEPKRLIVEAQWKEGEQNWHRHICRTFGYCDTFEEEQANAHLIAASKNMYEALDKIRDIADKLINETLTIKEIPLLKEQIFTISRQALTEAEGRQP